jgi:hypothetical protein
MGLYASLLLADEAPHLVKFDPGDADADHAAVMQLGAAASAKALASYINLFLEQARLQAEGRERWREEHGRETDED